jgi:hypothetical protein
MLISFDVAGVPAEFNRNAQTERAELRIGDEVICLQGPFNPATHVELSTRKVWRRRVGDHEVIIEKVRPRMTGGLRDNSYKVWVDDAFVAEATGE